MNEAVKYSVLPIDDRSIERFNDAYKEGDNRFTGRIHKITIEVK